MMAPSEDLPAQAVLRAQAGSQFIPDSHGNAPLRCHFMKYNLTRVVRIEKSHERLEGMSNVDSHEASETGRYR